MQVLALDVGQRRIGLAVGDTETGVAGPVGVIIRVSKARDVPAVLEAARRHGVETILVGIPYQMDGSLGLWGRSVWGFYEALRAASPARVETWDERLSTVAAEAALREAGRRPSRERAAVDAASAAVILQSYLDGLRGQGTTPHPNSLPSFGFAQDRQGERGQ
jgi:putative Holliday junction resolvase